MASCISQNTFLKYILDIMGISIQRAKDSRSVNYTLQSLCRASMSPAVRWKKNIYMWFKSNFFFSNRICLNLRVELLSLWRDIHRSMSPDCVVRDRCQNVCIRLAFNNVRYRLVKQYYRNNRCPVAFKKKCKKHTHTQKVFFCNTLVLSHVLKRQKHQAHWIILPAEKMGGKDISSS